MAKVRRPFDITSPAQVAALASIGEDAELARRRAVNAEGLARLESLLREHGLAPVPSVGNFLYVDTGGDANALYERLLHEGVIVRPLPASGRPPRSASPSARPTSSTTSRSRSHGCCSRPDRLSARPHCSAAR